MAVLAGLPSALAAVLLVDGLAEEDRLRVRIGGRCARVRRQQNRAAADHLLKCGEAVLVVRSGGQSSWHRKSAEEELALIAVAWRRRQLCAVAVGSGQDNLHI